MASGNPAGASTPEDNTAGASTPKESTVGASTPKSRRNDVVEAERERFGGIKFGSAFFGWLTAIGLTVILSAIATAIGVGVGASNTSDVNDAANQASENAQTIGIVSGIVLAVILFIAYYCGGYVAGRMARFDGAKQGLAVWLWGIIIAIVLAILAVVAGDQFNVLSNLDGAPSISLNQDTLTASGLIALAIAVLVPLLAAILGGKAGMAFHRKVDQVGVDLRSGR
jgi:magnesium-transporting ATPase (P-type)